MLAVGAVTESRRWVHCVTWPRGLRSQMELRLLVIWPRDGEIILGSLRGPYQSVKEGDRRARVRGGPAQQKPPSEQWGCRLCRWKGPWARECGFWGQKSCVLPNLYVETITTNSDGARRRGLWEVLRSWCLATWESLNPPFSKELLIPAAVTAQVTEHR